MSNALLNQMLEERGVSQEDMVEAIKSAKALPKREPIEIVKGSVLDAKEDLIVHQVNCFGRMGSGVALAIKNAYPDVYAEYKDLCDGFALRQNLKGEMVIDNDARKALIGHMQLIEVKSDFNPNTKGIVNAFGQYTYGNHKVQTLVSALRESLTTLRDELVIYQEYKSIAFPYLIGCGLGGGDIEVIDGIIREVFYNTDIEIKYYDIN